MQEMSEQEPTNAPIEDDAPRSTDDLIAYWVRTFDRWTSGAAQDRGQGQDSRSIESDTAA